MVWRGHGDLLFLASLSKDVRNKGITKVYDDVAIWQLPPFFPIPFSFFFVFFPSLFLFFFLFFPSFSFSFLYYELHYYEKIAVRSLEF
jgi:hypothetical protein